MKKSAVILRSSYLLVSVGLLFLSLIRLRGAPPLEGPAQILLFGMLALSFPAGLVVVYLWGYFAFVSQNANPGSSLEILLGAGTPGGMMILWSLLVVVGFFQWFLAFPWFVRWIRGRFPSTAAISSQRPHNRSTK